MGYRVLCFFLITLCVACAPQQGAQTKAASDEWRLQNIEARFLEYQEAQKEREAQLQSKVQDLDGQLTSVRRELDETKSRAGALQAETAAMKEALVARHIAVASEAPMAPAPSPRMTQPAKPAVPSAPPVASDESSLDQPMGGSAATIASATSNLAPAVPSSDPVSATVPDTVPVPETAEQLMATSNPEADAIYERGLDAARSGDAENGRILLDKFIGEYPNNPLVPNALYWLGETYYHEKRYAQAVLTFKEVVRRFPKHDKSAAAMLKTGFSYEMLGDKSNAQFYLQTLVEDYPSTAPAEMARKRLASM